MDPAFNILMNVVLYLSIPVAIRYVILRRPIQNMWIAMGILVPIFIGFATLIDIQRGVGQSKLHQQAAAVFGIQHRAYKSTTHLPGSPILYGAMVFSYLILRRRRKKMEVADHAPTTHEIIGGDDKKANLGSLGPMQKQAEGSLDSKNHSMDRCPTKLHVDGDVLILDKRADDNKDVLLLDKPVDSNKKAQLVLEYSDEAKENFDRLKELPGTLAQTFLEKLEEDPSQDTGRLADSLIKAYEAGIRPYRHEDQNRALAQARELGPEAEQEYRKVLALLGDKVDANKVLARLRQKFLGPGERKPSDPADDGLPNIQRIIRISGVSPEDALEISGTLMMLGILEPGVVEPDFSQGVGVIDDYTRCIWDKDGHRLTIRLRQSWDSKPQNVESASRSTEPDVLRLR